MHEGIAAIRALGSKDFLTYFLGVLAESLAKAGQVENALGVVTDALAAVEGSGERFYAAELHRLRGELLLATGHEGGEVDDCFRTALAMAHQQGRDCWRAAPCQVSDLRADAGDLAPRWLEHAAIHHDD
jgi:predicted ATPase